MYDKNIFRHMMMAAGLVSVCIVQAAEHQQQQAVTVVESCNQPGTLPSIECSKTPNATFDRKGRLWLVWVHGKHIYVQHSDDKGRHYSPPVVVNTVPETIAAQGENRPKIVIDKEGRIYVSWTRKLARRFSGHIRFSRSIDGGRHFSKPVTVNDHREVTGHRFESMAVNTRGDIYIAWLDKRDLLAAKKAAQPYTGAALYYTRSVDGGQSFRPNKKIADHTCQCCRTAMAMDRDGLPVILWRHIFGKNTRDHALVKFAGPEETGEVLRVSYEQWQVDACPHHGPAISIADDGIYHLAWFNNASARHGLFYAHSSNQGKTFSAPINFGDPAARAAHPQVLSLGKRVYLAWREFAGVHFRLLVMQSDDGGKHWSPPRLIDAAEESADYPLLLADADVAYVAWHRPGKPYRLFPLEEPE